MKHIAAGDPLREARGKGPTCERRLKRKAPLLCRKGAQSREHHATRLKRGLVGGEGREALRNGVGIHTLRHAKATLEQSRCGGGLSSTIGTRQDNDMRPGRSHSSVVLACGACALASSANNAFASCKSLVSNPSVNQLYTADNKLCASSSFSRVSCCVDRVVCC